MQEYYPETDRETGHETLQSAQIPLQCYAMHAQFAHMSEDLQGKRTIATNVSDLFVQQLL